MVVQDLKTSKDFITFRRGLNNYLEFCVKKFYEIEKNVQFEGFVLFYLLYKYIKSL